MVDSGDVWGCRAFVLLAARYRRLLPAPSECLNREAGSGLGLLHRFGSCRACLDGEAGRTSWANGDVLCYVNEAGYAQPRWTDERTDTHGVMNAVPNEARIKALARQWAGIVES
jgi:hypothetical protein